MDLLNFGNGVGWLILTCVSSAVMSGFVVWFATRKLRRRTRNAWESLSKTLEKMPDHPERDLDRLRANCSTQEVTDYLNGAVLYCRAGLGRFEVWDDPQEIKLREVEEKIGIPELGADDFRRACLVRLACEWWTAE